MRTLGLATLLAALLLALPGKAQQSGLFIPGGNAGKLVNKPIDTSKAMQGPNFTRAMQSGAQAGSFNKAFKQPGQSGNFGLGKLFSTMGLTSKPGTTTTTPLLSQKNNPFQPKALAGRNPFDPPPKKK